MFGDSDSDSGSELIRVSSTPLPPPKWDKAPDNIDYKQPCKPVRLVRLWLKLVRLVRFVRMSVELKIS